MADDAEKDNDFVLSGASILALISDRSLVLKQAVGKSNAQSNDHAATSHFLTQHLERLRHLASIETAPDAGIMQYTCSSIAVMSVLLMLGDMFS